MGNALSLVSGFATNPGATLTALTVNSGESLTVPAFTPGTQAEILAAWSPGATAGVFRIRSPRLHDLSQGIRMQRGAANFDNLMHGISRQPLYPADVLIGEISGGGAETDMGAMLQWFQDLPGVAARLLNPNDVAPRIRNIAGVEVDLTSGGVGAYGTPRALNFSFDTLKANTDYAILGYEVSAKVGVVCVFGPDTGNQHVGGPGSLSVWDTAEWFVQMSQDEGVPCIPVINGNNKGSTFVQIADVGNAVNSNVSLILAELG